MSFANIKKEEVDDMYSPDNFAPDDFELPSGWDLEQWMELTEVLVTENYHAPANDYRAYLQESRSSSVSLPPEVATHADLVVQLAPAVRHLKVPLARATELNYNESELLRWTTSTKPFLLLMLLIVRLRSTLSHA
jgi:hypothetical protein